MLLVGTNINSTFTFLHATLWGRGRGDGVWDPGFELPVDVRGGGDGVGPQQHLGGSPLQRAQPLEGLHEAVRVDHGTQPQVPAHTPRRQVTLQPSKLTCCMGFPNSLVHTLMVSMR